MAILKKNGELKLDKFEFLLRGPRMTGIDNPLSEWMSDSSWGTVHALKELDDYASLPGRLCKSSFFSLVLDDLIGSSKRWREWMELERPEDEVLPGEWKRMMEFDQLLIFRALRPDRLTAAMSRFVTKVIGQQYVTSQPFDLELSYQVCHPCIQTSAVFRIRVLEYQFSFSCLLEWTSRDRLKLSERNMASLWTMANMCRSR